jgi:ATP-dependent Clp protease ATP-binding subunit ClpC
MYERFTDRARNVMKLANQEAMRFNHEYIGTEHILLGLVKEGSGVAANVLKNLDIDLRKVHLEVEKIVQSGPDMAKMARLPPTPRAKKVIEYAIEEARTLDHNYVGSEHLLLGLVREGEGVAAQVLANLGVKLEDVREEVLNMVGTPIHPTGRALFPSGERTSPSTRLLDQVGLDLTSRARAGILDPVIGRRAEIERVLMVLGCRERNNPVLVGPVGVGKAAIVRGLAWQSAGSSPPEVLCNRRVVVLSVARIVDQAEGWRHLEEIVRRLVDQVRQAGNVILFLEDLASLLVPGCMPGNFSPANLLKSVVSGGDVRCIAATTAERYRVDVTDDGLFGRHFQPVAVQPPSAEEAVAILHGLWIRLESHHRVRIADDALEAAVALSERHLPQEALPGKALRVLDQACALAQLRHGMRQPGLGDLEVQIDRLNREKEAAVAEQDFQKAAGFRDQADQLMKEREARLTQWREQMWEITVRVDREAIAAVIQQMTGTSPEP